MTELFNPPRFFKDVHFHKHTDRSISWLELFYDLVYVATLIQIGNFLSDNLTLLGFAQFLVLMAVVWWSWTGETFFQNRFVVDDWLHRLLVFGQMFAIATIGVSVSGAFGELYVQFTLAYAVARLFLVIMYLRAWRAHPASRPMSITYVTGFSLGILIWLGSLLLPAELHWVGWLVAIAVEFGTPLLPHMRRLQLQWRPDTHHVMERFGIFTIIVLGEAFVKILDDRQGELLGLDPMLFSTFGFIVFYSLWWLYFSDTADKMIDFSRYQKPVAWIYGHLPLAVGLVAFAVGAKKLFSEVIEHPGDPIKDEYRLIYTAALVIYLLALAAIDYGLDDDLTHQKQNREALVHLISAGVIAVLGLTLTGLDAIGFVAVLAVIMLAQVLYSVYVTRDEALAVEAAPHTEPAAD